MNDDAQQFLPRGYGRRGQEWEQIAAEGNVVVEIGSGDMLLAMKLFAAQTRGRREQVDLAVLLEATGTRTVDDAETILGEFYPGETLTARTASIVQAALDSGYTGRPEDPPRLV